VLEHAVFEEFNRTLEGPLRRPMGSYEYLIGQLHALCGL
jgi:hypothetical protein